jgi:hypothetical protein
LWYGEIKEGGVKMAKKGVRSVNVHGYTRTVKGKKVHVTGYSRKKGKK